MMRIMLFSYSAKSSGKFPGAVPHLEFTVLNTSSHFSNCDLKCKSQFEKCYAMFKIVNSKWETATGQGHGLVDTLGSRQVPEYIWRQWAWTC
jgi:hypothetical protein